jgi:hypothetical protein
MNANLRSDDNVRKLVEHLNNSLHQKENELQLRRFYQSQSDIPIDDLERGDLRSFKETIEWDYKDKSVDTLIEIFSKIKEKAPTATISISGDYGGEVYITAYVDRPETDDEFNTRCNLTQEIRYNNWKYHYDALTSEIASLKATIKFKEVLLNQQNKDEITKLHQLAKIHGFKVSKNQS